MKKGPIEVKIDLSISERDARAFTVIALDNNQTVTNPGCSMTVLERLTGYGLLSRDSDRYRVTAIGQSVRKILRKQLAPKAQKVE